MKKLLLAMVGVAFAAASANATFILGWDVAGLGTEETVDSASNATGLGSSTISIAGGSALNPNAGANSLNMRDWSEQSDLAGAITDNAYFSFTITPDAGFVFSVDSISWRIQRSSTGPQNFALLSSDGGFTAGASLGSASYTGTTATNLDPAFDNIGLSGLSSAVEFRVYGWGATAGTGTTRIQDGANFGETGIDFAVFGSVIPEPGTLGLMALGLLGVAYRRRR